MEVLVIGLVAVDVLDPLFVIRVLGHDIKDFNFVIGCLLIVRSALLYLKSNISVVEHIASQPDSREVTPTKFLNNHVSIDHDLANMDWMVATNLIVGDSLVLTLITVSV